MNFAKRISRLSAVVVAVALVSLLAQSALFAVVPPVKTAGIEEKANGAGKPLLEQPSEKSSTTGGWMVIGAGGQVRLTSGAAETRTGKPGLAFDYNVAPKQFTVALLPVPEGSLAEMTSLRFWLKTDSSTSVAVVLSERKPGGGNYLAIVWSPGGAWHEIELTPRDFAPSEGPNDPKDPDGKLDLDQVEGVGIIDLGALFSNLADQPNLPLAIDKKNGPHTLWLDDFQAFAGSLSSPSASGTRVLVIDDFQRASLRWLTLGGAQLSVSKTGNPLAQPALEASYEQAEGRYVVIAHPLANLDLSKTKHLTFDIASTKDAEIVVSLEERKPGSDQGPRYNATIEVPGGQHPVHEELPFADFTLDEHSPADPDGKLDLDQLKSISLADITAALSHEQQKNTLWIANLEAEGSAGEAVPKPHETHEMSMGGGMPMDMNHGESARVEESMASHHMHMGPHMKLTGLRPASPDDQKRADEVVKSLRVALEPYKDYRAAEKDGYEPYMPNLTLPEYHFTNYKYALLSQFRFDPTHPTSLLYKKTRDGYDLVGAMYTAPARASEDALDARIPLSVGRWHLHVNVCEPSGGMTEKANWLRFGPAGLISTEQECQAAGGTFHPHLFGWMIHAYPFEATPDRIWAH